MKYWVHMNSVYKQRGNVQLIIASTVLFILIVLGGYFLRAHQNKSDSKNTSPLPINSNNWENPDEQFKQGNTPAIYTSQAKNYPKDFNECVRLTKEIRDVPETFKQSVEKRKICYWESNRKYSSGLLHCPSYGRIDKQTICGDFACEKPFYICKFEFQNPNYQEPQNYNECVERDGINCDTRFQK